MPKVKMKESAKPKYGMWQNTRYMVKLAWSMDEKKVVVLCLLAAVTEVALNLINLYVSPTILSVVERRAPASVLIGTIAAFVLGLILFSAAKTYIGENTLYGRVSIRSIFVSMLNKKGATTSYPNLFDDRYQKLNAKARSTIANNRAATEAVWSTLSELAKNLLGFTVYVLLLSSLQPVLMLVILAASFISYLVNSRVSEWGYHHRDEEAEPEKQLIYLYGRTEDLTAAKDIRIFGLRPWIDELSTKAMDAYTAFHERAQSVYIWGKIADLVMSFVRNAAAYAYLIGLVLAQSISVSEFLLFFGAAGGFTVWVSGILGNLNTLHKQSLDISTMRECLEFEEPFRFENGEHLEPISDKKYEIRLENVSFRYPEAEKDTLSGINLTLHPGEKLAVVGLNGAGKTTLIKLICGFLDPTEGRVLLDGRDIRDFNRADYYMMFSAVFQTFSLLAGTVAANVAQDNIDIDMDRVRASIEKAGLRGKIESLENGYETNLNRVVFEDAVLLSGGETQRLMLARALYKDAPFIVLDEPTAALDPIAEAEMYQKYNDMTGGRSSVYISHRLASTRFCDRIIMIADGGICEEGTHDELLALGGSYAELYEVQSKYYREGENENEES